MPSQAGYFIKQAGAIAARWLRLGLLAALFLSCLGYWGNQHWLLDLAAHFKLQYGIIGTIALVFFSLKRQELYRTPFIFLSLVCVLLNLAVLLPWYLPQSSRSPQSPVPLRVLLSNVHVRNQDYAKVLSLVREVQPDIAVFLETNQAWLSQLDTLRDQLPYRHSDPRHAQFGIALYSALPLANPTTRFFAHEAASSLLATVTKGGKTVSLLATHAPPPINATYFAWRNQQLAAIGEYVRQIQTPVVVLGDLNITPWSPNYRPLVHQTGLSNSRMGFGILPTWTTALPILLIPIDHCLVSLTIQTLHIQTANHVGSDHLPVVVQLAI